MTVLGGRFAVERTVRETAASQVFACRDLALEGSDLVAVKMVRPELCVLGTQEFTMLRALRDVDRDGRIVHARGLFVENGRACIVMELLGDSLHDRARQATRVNVAVFVQVAREILQSVQFVHEQGIIHADIKPGNFAFLRNAPGRLKLLDFGNAITFADASLYFDHFEVQTTRYRAPECVFGVPFGAKIDIWSTAVTLLELALGKPLFTASRNKDLVAQWRQFFGRVDPAPFVAGKFYSDRSVARQKRPKAGADPLKVAPAAARTDAARPSLGAMATFSDPPRSSRLRAYGSAECRSRQHDPQQLRQVTQTSGAAAPRHSHSDHHGDQHQEWASSMAHRRSIGSASSYHTRNSTYYTPSDGLDSDDREADFDVVHARAEEDRAEAGHGRSASTGSSVTILQPSHSSSAEAEPDTDMDTEPAPMQIWDLARVAQLASPPQKKFVRRHDSSPIVGSDSSTYRARGESRPAQESGARQMDPRASTGAADSANAHLVADRDGAVDTEAARRDDVVVADDDDNDDDDDDDEEEANDADDDPMSDSDTEAHHVPESPRSQPASIGRSRAMRIASPALNAAARGDAHDGSLTRAVEPLELRRVRAEIHNLLCLHGSEIALSEGCVDLLARMLVFDPARRLSAAQALEHPILQV